MAEKVVLAIMSGIGAALAIIQTLISKAMNAGLTEEDIHRLSTPEGEKLIDKFVALMVREFHPKPAKMTYEEIFNVLVDYNRSIEDLVNENGTDFVSSEICDKYFPSIKTGWKIQKIILVSFGEALETAEVLAKLKEQGLRPVDAQELLTLGYREDEAVQSLNMKVAALGQLTDRILNEGRISCIILDCSYEWLKILRINYFANDWYWDENTVFAAVPN